MPRAFCLIKEQPFYRRDAFVAGLKAAGYDVQLGTPTSKVNNGDVLVSWNRYGTNEIICDRFEAEGGTVIVVENGYLNQRGGSPKFDAHEGVLGYYALALHGHNGSGVSPTGDASRWAALGIELRPWRTDGEHILVCKSRPFGSREMIPPPSWAENVAARLRKQTDREIRVRQHPGNNRPERALAADLENCWAVVIWASSAGVSVLINGIPVICESPYWICKEAALNTVSLLDEKPVTTGNINFDTLGWLRQREFEKLAWAQFHIEEIAGGLPFELLLNAKRIHERTQA